MSRVIKFSITLNNITILWGTVILLTIIDKLFFNLLLNKYIYVQERGNSSGHKNERSDQVKMESDYTELKKRGLCLVPLSMVVNYLR